MTDSLFVPELVGQDPERLLAATKMAAFYFPSVRVNVAGIMIPSIATAKVSTAREPGAQATEGAGVGAQGASEDGFAAFVAEDAVLDADMMREILRPMRDEGLVAYSPRPDPETLLRWVKWWESGLDVMRREIVEEATRDGVDHPDARVSRLFATTAVELALLCTSQGIPTATHPGINHLFRVGYGRMHTAARSTDPLVDSARKSREAEAHLAREILAQKVPSVAHLAVDELLELRHRRKDHLIAFRAHLGRISRASDEIDPYSDAFPDVVRKIVETEIDPLVVELQAGLKNLERKHAYAATTGGAVSAGGGFGVLLITKLEALAAVSPATAASVAGVATAVYGLHHLLECHRERQALLGSHPMSLFI